MKRKLRTFGVAAIAALAMSAVAANAAGAAEFHSENENTTLTGTSTGSAVLDFASASLTCKKASFSGTQAEKTADPVTMTVQYKECTFLFFNVNINMNGCDYVFHANGEIDIAGTECKGITWEGAGCKVVFPAQTGKNKVTYTNTGSGATRSVDVSTAVTGVKYTSSGFCPKNGTFEDGNFTTGPWILTGNKGGVWVE